MDPIEFLFKCRRALKIEKQKEQIKKQSLEKGHPWFAWHPVIIIGDKSHVITINCPRSNLGQLTFLYGLVGLLSNGSQY